MTAIRIFSAAILSIAVLAVQAQTAPEPQAAPASAAATKSNCPRPRVAPHDHGREKGYPPTAARPCKAASGVNVSAS